MSTKYNTENQSQPVRAGFFYGYIIVAISFLMMMVAWIPYYAFGVFFTPMLTEFGWTRAITSGAFSGSQIVRGLVGIIMGRLNDKIGPRIVLTGCALLLGTGFLLMYFIHSLWQFYAVFIFLLGIGFSGFWVPLISTVARWFVKKRASMSGLVMTATGVGVLLGAPIANLLLSYFDWRFTYVLMGVLILLVIPISAQFLRREPADTGQFPDGEKRSFSSPKIIHTGVSFAEAARTKHFWIFSLATTCLGYCIFTVTVHIVPYALDLKISPIGAANILAVFGAFTLIGRLAMGNAADRVGDRLLYLFGFITITLAFLLLITVEQNWMLYLFAALFGSSQGGMGTVGSPLLAELFGLRSHGLIFGVTNCGFAFGAALGPFFSGYIFDLTSSYQGAFMVCFSLGFLGVVLSVLLRKAVVKLG